MLSGEIALKNNHCYYYMTMSIFSALRSKIAFLMSFNFISKLSVFSIHANIILDYKHILILF